MPGVQFGYEVATVEVGALQWAHAAAVAIPQSVACNLRKRSSAEDAEKFVSAEFRLEAVAAGNTRRRTVRCSV